MPPFRARATDKLQARIRELEKKINDAPVVWRKDIMYNPYAPTWKEDDWEKGRWIKDES